MDGPVSRGAALAAPMTQQYILPPPSAADRWPRGHVKQSATSQVILYQLSTRSFELDYKCCNSNSLMFKLYSCKLSHGLEEKPWIWCEGFSLWSETHFGNQEPLSDCLYLIFLVSVLRMMKLWTKCPSSRKLLSKYLVQVAVFRDLNCVASGCCTRSEPRLHTVTGS